MISVIICPGIHDLKLTQDFLEGLKFQWSGQSASSNLVERVLVFPAHEYPAYSAIDIYNFICSKLNTPSLLTSPVVFVSFSAGVAGAIGAAWAWQMLSGRVKAFMAVDGWGVPLVGNFPIHRMSHDYFTHWSSAILGSGEDSFYADPPVEHLELWRSPQTAQGWWVHSAVGLQQRLPTTATLFLVQMLQRYAE